MASGARTASSNGSSPKQLELLWRAPLGAGYCGPTVADKRVFVMDRRTEPQQLERVLCFDARTGTRLWLFSYPCNYAISYTAGPRASVTVDGTRAFALGAMGHLHCLDVGTGTVLWKRDLNRDYAAAGRSAHAGMGDRRRSAGLRASGDRSLGWSRRRLRRRIRQEERRGSLARAAGPGPVFRSDTVATSRTRRCCLLDRRQRGGPRSPERHGALASSIPAGEHADRRSHSGRGRGTPVRQLVLRRLAAAQAASGHARVWNRCGAAKERTSRIPTHSIA